MRGASLFLLAVICGAAAVVGVMRLRPAVPKATEPETVDVLVANIEIYANEQLNSLILATKKWPKQFVPEGAVTNIEDVDGWYMTTQTAKGEPILKSKLSREPVGLTAKITPGMRAISILTPKYSSALAGLVSPGQHVDVVWTRKQGGNRGLAETLLQNLVVLAVDRQMRPDAAGDARGNPKQVQAVTLEVTPSQAERLSSAQLEGEVSLVLRGSSDEGTENPTSPTQSAADEQKLASAIDNLEAMFAKRQDAIEASVTQLGRALDAFLSKPAAEPAPPAPGNHVRLLDIPVYTLRGNAWGYVMTRKPVLRSPSNDRASAQLNPN